MRKTVQQAFGMESRQAFLSAIVESSNDAIISKNLSGIITTWNAGAQRIFGYTEQEVTGKPITILIPALRLQEEAQILQEIKNGHKVDHFETIRLNKSGMEIPISLTVSPIMDKRGSIIGASKIARDITDQLQAQKAIIQNSRNLEILNSIGKSISEKLDVKAILQRVTDATTDLMGSAYGVFLYNTINEKGENFLLHAVSGVSQKVIEKFGMLPQTKAISAGFSGINVIRADDVWQDAQRNSFFPYLRILQDLMPVTSFLAVPVNSLHGTIIGGLFLGHPDRGVFKAVHEDMIISIASQSAVALDNSRLFEEIKALNAKKDEFIAVASHELKTPLTTIHGYLQILQKKINSPVELLFIEKSLKQVLRVDRLVDELLDVSKIEAGKLHLNPEIFDIGLLLKEVIETFDHAVGTHKLMLEGADQVFLLEADKQRIEQVLINLLSNAIKYSPDAQRVYITLLKDDKSIKITVKDEGIGLRPEQQKQLFQRFYRAEERGRISGLGLGLFLAKEIIDRHKGTIGVSSEYGKGSEFFFVLPRKYKQG